MKYLQNQRLHHPLIKRKLVNNVISLTENWQACVYHSEVQCSIYLQVVHVECQSRNVTFYYTTVNMSLYQILAHVLKTALGVERRRTNLKTCVTISKSAECNIIYSSGTGTRHEPLPDSLPVCIQQQQVSKDKPRVGFPLIFSLMKCLPAYLSGFPHSNNFDFLHTNLVQVYYVSVILEQ